MRTFILTDREEPYDYDTLYVGTTEEIKSLYKSIARNQCTNIIPTFSDPPKFSEYRIMYGLYISSDNYMQVINSDTVLSILLAQNADHDIEEINKKVNKHKPEIFQNETIKPNLLMGRRGS